MFNVLLPIFIFLFSPLLLLLSHHLLVHFSLHFLVNTFWRSSALTPLAKKEEGHVFREARNLWEAQCPGDTPAAKQKHKSWLSWERIFQREEVLESVQKLQILSGLGLTFSSSPCLYYWFTLLESGSLPRASYISFCIPWETFKLFQAYLSYLPPKLLFGTRKYIFSFSSMYVCVNSKELGFGVKDLWVELWLTTHLAGDLGQIP